MRPDMRDLLFHRVDQIGGHWETLGALPEGQLLMIALCAVLCGGRQGVRTGALARHRISTDPPGAVYRVISIDRDAPPPSADTTR
jgi:hypothetical protein